MSHLIGVSVVMDVSEGITIMRIFDHLVNFFRIDHFVPSHEVRQRVTSNRSACDDLYAIMQESREGQELMAVLRLKFSAEPELACMWLLSENRRLGGWKPSEFLHERKPDYKSITKAASKVVYTSERR